MPDSRAPIAVTGACGFVGANIVLHLARHGRPVIACDTQPPPEALRDAAAAQPGPVRWVELDVTQEDRWAVLDGEPLAALIHGAAVTPGSADPTPARTAHVNLWGTIAGLEYARGRGGLRVVFLSSSAVYGIARSSRPLRVTRRVAPRTAYAASKLCAECFVSTYAATYGLDACSARLAAAYGPWERPTATRPRPSPIFRLVTAALQGLPVGVSGVDVGRDWIYSEDIAAGVSHLATIERLPYDMFNLSTGVAVTLKDVVEVVKRLMPEAAIQEVGSRRADIALSRRDARSPLDVTRMREAGFIAAAGLEDGVARYVEWLRGEGMFVLRP